MELSKVKGIEIKRFAAIDGRRLRLSGLLSPAEVGCLKSHYNVLSKTKSELTLVLEDDFEFADNFEAKLEKCLNELPEDFQALWLGGRLVGRTTDFSENLLKISGITGTYGYIVRKSFIGDVLGALKRENKLADWAMSSVFKNVFKSKENLIKHRAGFSVIQNKFVDYEDLK